MAFSNDTQIFFTVVVFFFVLGIIAPFINLAMDNTPITQNTDNLVTTPSLISLAGLSSLLNIILIPFWTLGFPTWLNVVFIPFRILIVYLGYRALRGI